MASESAHITLAAFGSIFYDGAPDYYELGVCGIAI